MSEEASAGGRDTSPGDEPLAGVAGDELSAGISESGVGGQEIGEGDGDETGLDEIVDGASRTGWGRPSHGDDS